MSGLHMIWATSAAGAAIFFALGYVVRLVSRPAFDRGDDRPEPRLARAEEPTREEVPKRAGRSGSSSGRLEALSRQLSESAAEVARLTRALADAEGRAEEAETRVSSTPSGASPRPEEGEAAAERDRLRHRVERLEEACGEAGQERALAEEGRRAALAELDETKERLAETQRELEVERQRRVAADKERLAARTELAMDRSKARALEKAKAEELGGEAEHERTAAKLAAKAQETARLEARVSVLEARLLAAGLDPPKDAEPQAVQARVERASSASVDVALASLAAVAELRVALVADDMGLVIAGAGEAHHHEDVAALSGLAHTVASRARNLLPLDTIRQMVLEDANDVVLTFRLFDLSGGPLALCMLGSTAPPSREVVDRHLDSLCKSLA